MNTWRAREHANDGVILSTRIRADDYFNSSHPSAAYMRQWIGSGIVSDNGLSPGHRRAIIWTNAGILLIEPLETNFSEILIEFHTFSFKKLHFEMSSVKWRPFCLGLNVLMHSVVNFVHIFVGSPTLDSCKNAIDVS